MRYRFSLDDIGGFWGKPSDYTTIFRQYRTEDGGKPTIDVADDNYQHTNFKDVHNNIEKIIKKDCIKLKKDFINPKENEDFPYFYPTDELLSDKLRDLSNWLKKTLTDPSYAPWLHYLHEEKKKERTNLQNKMSGRLPTQIQHNNSPKNMRPNHRHTYAPIPSAQKEILTTIQNKYNLDITKTNKLKFQKSLRNIMAKKQKNKAKKTTRRRRQRYKDSSKKQNNSYSVTPRRSKRKRSTSKTGIPMSSVMNEPVTSIPDTQLNSSLNVR